MSSPANDDVVLSVAKICKSFGSLKKSIFSKKAEPFWAVKDVSFELRKGQILGIIGHNGAGKSTLLKILAEVIAPSSGHVKYKGGILSILEIGTGFHPDLSGYKNIFLNGSVLGMKKQRIAEKVDEIIAFSGIADHIHEPVKNYSSGMYLRLALSIALFAENDILLLDEVISVGDMEFRHKAIQRVKAQAMEGKTCVMISHDLGSVIEICDECLLMENGSVVDRGTPKLMVEKYYDVFYNRLKTQNVVALNHPFCEVLSVSVEKDTLSMNEPVLITITYKVKETFDFRFFLKLRSFHANVLTASNAFNQHINVAPLSPGIYQTTCTIPANLFNAGSYMIDVIVGSEEQIFVEYMDACRFKLLLDDWEKDKSWNSSLDLFAFRPNCSWSTVQANE